MKKLLIISLAIINYSIIYCQSVGIGTTTPSASAQLDVSSTSKGFLMPRMTTAQRNAIVSPAVGLQIFNLDDQCTDIYDGANWIKTCGYKKTGTATIPANLWIKKTDLGGAARYDAVGFSINSKGYVGTGNSGTPARPYKDFWENDPLTEIWTQKADFGGDTRTAATGFAIGNKGYIGTGSYSGNHNDFWEYDPATNTWLQKADFPGSARNNAVGFSIDNFGYIGTGNDGIYKNDFYQYDPVSNSWLQKSSFGGTPRSKAVGFSIGTKGYVGTGYDGTYKSDFWEYNPGTNNWTAVTSFSGTARSEATGFSINGNGYLGTGNSGSQVLSDFWQFNPTANSWTQLASYDHYYSCVGFSIGTKGYIGTGYDDRTYKTFKEYNPTVASAPIYTIQSPVAAAGFSNGIWTKGIFDIYTLNNGNVGIGTSTPNQKLSVIGNGNFTGYLGLEGAVSNAPLQFESFPQSRKIVLYEGANNDNQFYGFGVNSGVLRYQTNTLADDHVFYAGVDATSSNELMRIKGNGNVGIGTSSPNYKLHIGQSTSGLRVEGPAVPGGIALGIGGFGDLQIDKPGTAGGRFIVKDNGNVGIGTATPTAKLNVAGAMVINGDQTTHASGAWLEWNKDAGGGATYLLNQKGSGAGGIIIGELDAANSVKQNLVIEYNGNATLAGVLTQNSDARLKKNIHLLSSSLQNLQQINGYTYNWKDKSKDNIVQVGVLAQEVQKIYPQLVKTAGDGTLSVNYNGLVPVLIEAIKEQQKQIDELKKLVESMLANGIKPVDH